MNLPQSISRHLGQLDSLLETGVSDDGKGYIQPTRRNLGVVSIVLLREAIAPVVFRNEDQTLTRIAVPGVSTGDRLRATPNKTKFVERGIGLQILRAMGTGGRFAQNRTVVEGDPGDAFDLNTAVFGDSAMSGTRVLPVKAGVNYSDAISLQPAASSEVSTMHIASNEEGTLFDPETQKNSVNLFDRNVVRPGTLFVQVLTLRGKVLPAQALDHLLLCLGMAGSYGGQTSVSGTNLRTRIVGVFGGQFEQAVNSPYALVAELERQGFDMASSTPEQAASKLFEVVAARYEDHMAGDAAEAYRNALMERFVADDAVLRQQYQDAARAYKAYFSGYFGSGKPAKAKAARKGRATQVADANDDALDDANDNTSGAGEEA